MVKLKTFTTIFERFVTFCSILGKILEKYSFSCLRFLNIKKMRGNYTAHFCILEYQGVIWTRTICMI